jgi:hypothetical protein
MYASSTSALATGSGLVFDGANLGVGTTTLTSGGGWTPRLVLAAAGAAPAWIIKGGSSQELSIGASDSMYIDCSGSTTGTNNNIIFRTTSTNSSFSVVEAARITSDGNLLVGTTSLSNRLSVVAPSGQYVARFGLNGTGSQSFINFVVGENTTPTGVGSVTYNGSLTLYNQTSDQRLKENIVDAETALTTLNQIKIRAFDWIQSKKHETHGVIAQELNLIAPQCVTEGVNNADGSIDRPWQVDTSPLVPMLIKAIQEQSAIITQLTARITALEGT